MTLPEKHQYFLQTSVVRGKVIKIAYFHKQGLEVFLEKLRIQGWLDLFMNTQGGCSIPKFAEFYAHCVVTNVVVTSTIGGHKLRFDAADLGEMLGVLADGFTVYVREDKTMLGEQRLLKLTQRLAQDLIITRSRSVRKGEMLPLHRLLFWFVIKNVIPRGQGCNLADPMDMCLTDLLDWGEKINLPAIMIYYIARIANTSKDHDMRYGFLLTSVFE